MSEFKDGSRQPLPASTPMGLRELLDAAPDLIFACDSAGRFEWMNPAAERLLGFKSADLLNRPFSQLLDPSGRVSAIRAFRRMALRQSPELQRVVRVMTNSGRPVALDVSVSRRVRLDDEISFVGTARPWNGSVSVPGAPAVADVAAHSPEVASLKSDQAGLRSELSSARNEASKLKTELAKAREDASGAQSDLARARSELTALKSEAGVRAAEVSDLSKRLEESSRSAAASAASAATLASRAEDASTHAAALEDIKSQLGAKSSEIDQLNRQLADARALVQLRSEFLATMSQEFRAPMTGILGTASLLLESELDTDQRSMVELVQVSGQSLLTLINDTIDFSRFEAGSVDFERIGFDLRVTVEEVAQMLAPLANAKDLSLDCRVHHEVPSRLVGDPSRLRQVLLNLGACSVKNTGKGGVRLRIDRTEENDHGVTLRFAVSDSREGAPDAELASLYRCYTEDDGDQARRMGGAGLSLAISRQLVIRMGGRAGLDHDPARGSTLWFEVPLDKQAEETKPAEAPTIQLRGVRVLVVDPSRATRDATLEMLSAWGCRAEALDQAESALVKLRRAANQGEPYGAALIEMQLTGSNGEELGWAIHSDPVLSQTRTLLMTSLGRKGDAQRAQSMGFSAYLMKPLQWAELYEALVEVLSQPPVEPGALASALVTRHSLAEARRGRVRVLLAEDNAVNQLVAEWALRRLGYSIEPVSSAARAIETSEKDHYDVILMDVQLPDMDGCKAAAAIRARERGRHTPIIGMSSRALEGDRARCMESGMDDCIRKPIDLGQLSTLVQQMTSGKIEALSADDVVPVDAAGATPAGAAVSTVPGAGDKPQPKLRLVPETGADGEDAAATGPASAPVAAEGDHAAPLVPIDTGRLEESCMGIPALRDALLQTFRADIGPRMTRLAEAIVQGDPRRVEFESHGLKGMSATIGAVACEAAFEEIERLGRDEDLRSASRLLQIAQGTVERTEQFIARLERILGGASQAA
jgi:PAS domain S-box-containing protein